MTRRPLPDLLRAARTRLAATRVWRALMTPVVPVPVRAPTKDGRRRRQPHGIALFTVLVGIALMTTVVTDLGYNEMVRYKLAAHQRDAMKAQALAESGLNTARMLLAVQDAIQPMVSQLVQAGIPLPSHTVWELIPLESDLLKAMASGDLQQAVGIDVSGAVEERRERLAQLKEDKLNDYDADAEGATGSGPFIPPEGGFGGFDGSFTVQIQDEERKAATLHGWQTATTTERFAMAQRVFTVIQPERYDFLFEERDPWGNRTDRYELVANLYDWIDLNEDASDPRASAADWGRSGGGAEDGLYTSYDPVAPKNDYFDSPMELRLVRGMTDAHMAAFADSISLYADKKINILSAGVEAIESLVRICAATPDDPLLFDPLWMRRTVQSWMECKAMGPLVGGCVPSPKGFISYLGSGMGTDGVSLGVNDRDCEAAMTTESTYFTVKATGTVGDVSRTLQLVLRVASGTEEKYYYSIVAEGM